VNYNVATLSRGYKRKSEGFILADATNAEVLGDEPFNFIKIQEIWPLMPIGRTGSNNYFRKSKTRSDITR
jgi:tetraacyldisaccharide 4'-kinase